MVCRDGVAREGASEQTGRWGPRAMLGRQVPGLHTICGETERWVWFGGEVGEVPRALHVLLGAGGGGCWWQRWVVPQRLKAAGSRHLL